MAIAAPDRSPPSAKVLAGVKQLPASYKGVLLDQFGVLHDGQQPYVGAIDAVHEMAASGLSILVLSNSSRRAAGALDKLAKMGFDAKNFAGAVTSGEIAHTKLLQRTDSFWAGLGKRCLHFTWSSRGAVSLEGLGLEVVHRPEDADFILASGTEALGRGDAAEPLEVEVDEFHRLMRCCTDRGGVPLICANPDVVTVDGTALRPMPGAFAKAYADMGGEVHLMGKPAPVIYETALAMLGLPRQEVIAIGDSLEHDIAGASAAGIDSVFIPAGIHAEDLGITATNVAADSTQLGLLCEQHGAAPTYIMPYLRP
ncbi:hypothetical protein WJX72_006196 [[Myrmecia] bisecta]|uniref:Uncharacterized protein n=1 Tax=[Myrmecia] bisecta TaxID=41462 RepID=A0AAW1PNJ5_9CHLO